MSKAIIFFAMLIFVTFGKLMPMAEAECTGCQYNCNCPDGCPNCQSNCQCWSKIKSFNDCLQIYLCINYLLWNQQERYP